MTVEESLKKSTFVEKLKRLIRNVNISLILKCLPVNLINTELMVCFLLPKILPCLVLDTVYTLVMILS